MQRVCIEPRNNWQRVVEDLGFGFHTTNVPYWDESACYSFSMKEVLAIEQATAELWTLCLAAIEQVVARDLFEPFRIPSSVWSYIKRTWREDHGSIYGRFDLCMNQGQIKMLEFNADTPTSLYEAAIVQWFWLQDFDSSKDQFNNLHERLIEHWRFLAPYLYPGPLHFSCLKGTLEDLTNTEYLRDCAIQAGIQTKLVFVEDIGWEVGKNQFVDMEQLPIRNLFKLYPWEWLITEQFGNHFQRHKDLPLIIEPAWKLLLSNKALLPLLWQLFPNHPLLLPAFFDKGDLHSFVKKPIFSREGANVTIFKDDELLLETPGDYGQEGFIYQQYFPLPQFQGRYPVIGSWLVGQEPAGMGIRESESLVTGNLSCFVPHFITTST